MGRFSLARKLATSLVVAFLVGGAAAAAMRLRPAPDPDGPERPAAGSVGAADRLETMFFDVLAQREATRRIASPDLVLVTIDEASVKRARESAAGGWPWPRGYLGTLVKELRDLGAKLVVLDASFADPSRLAGDDARFAAAVDIAGGVVAGFTFAEAPEEGIVEPGRWAILQGSYATRGAALLAAGPLLAGGARPYLVTSGDRIEVWLGGLRDHALAQKEAERLRGSLGLGTRDAAPLRELKAEETMDRVTVDVLFAERNAVPFGGGSLELKTFQNLQPPVAELAASTAGFGNLRLERDADGVVRGVRHLWRHEGRYYPSLALAVAMALTGRREVSFEDDRLHLGELGVPVDGLGITRLRFYGPAEKGGALGSPYLVVPVLSIVRSAERRAEGKSLDDKLADKLRGKVAFVSFDAGACERPSTPLSATGLRASAWATALDNLLRSDGVLRATADQDGAVAFAMALVGALVSLLFTRSTRPWRTIFLQLAATGLVGFGYLSWAWRAYRSGLWVATVVPMLAFLVAMVVATAVNYADEKQAVRNIREALGRYALPALVEQLLRRPHHLALEGDRRTLTCLVVDLHGFDEAVVSVKPKDLMGLLDDHVREVSEAVAAHHGQVDTVSGAHVVAYWGAPLPNPRHALDACLCALLLRDKLAGRVAAWKEDLETDLAVEIGLSTAEVVVGNIHGRGSFRPRFAVFGRGMASAASLSAHNATLRTRILVGEGTFEAVREEVGAREVDLLREQGRPRPSRVIELRALKSDQTAADRTFCERFDQAVVGYRRRDFKAALELFEALAKEHPEDGPVGRYLERCKGLLAHPPGEEWDGIYVPP